MNRKPVLLPDSQHPTWWITDSGFKALFGLPPKTKWPAIGFPVREVPTAVGGTMKMWVEPILPTSRQGKPRLFCNCPKCGKQFSGGRIQQHYPSCATKD